MEFVHQYVDANALASVVSLPESFRNQKVELIVLPLLNKQTKKPSVDVSAIVDSLTGAIPQSDKTLEEWREERLKKYEAVD